MIGKSEKSSWAREAFHFLLTGVREAAIMVKTKQERFTLRGRRR